MSVGWALILSYCGTRFQSLEEGVKATGVTRMWATATMKNEERFSFSNFIEVLDEMQHVDHHLNFFTSGSI